mmetsp:Transcript_116692/g.183514  ORF Transcript_116692/g.183514 Transcript_116692/m.183514 type:complete len:174 (-) Transcript_116692:106-627(-)
MWRTSMIVAHLASSIHAFSPPLSYRAGTETSSGVAMRRLADALMKSGNNRIRDPSIAGYAKARNVRMSPTKVRRPINEIRGKSYAEALTLLEYMPYHSCMPIAKVVKSAAANAVNNHGYDNIADLYVAAAYVDQGPTLKRMRPRAQGRAYSIQKKTCSITIEMKEKEKPKEEA